MNTMRKCLLGALILLVAGTLALPTPVPAQAQAKNLLQMLNTVPAEPRSAIWYASLADLNSVLGVKIDSRQAIDSLPSAQRVTYLFELGQQVYFSAFSGVERSDEWTALFKINPFAIAREVTIGGDNPVGVLQGAFDSGQITGALNQLGYLPVQVGSTSVLGLGADNSNDAGNPVQALAGPNMNRLLISNNFIIAAASTDAIQNVIAASKKIASNPVYSALAQTLEANALPGGLLLSAALLDGEYLRGTVFAGDPLAGSGLSADQLGLNNPLPAYQAVGFGYHRSAQARLLEIALVYSGDTANQAGPVLIDRLAKYRSLSVPERYPFQGWDFSSRVVKMGSLSVLVVQAQVPAQTDVAWVQMVKNRDIAFLLSQ